MIGPPVQSTRGKIIAEFIPPHIELSEMDPGRRADAALQPGYKGKGAGKLFQGGGLFGVSSNISSNASHSGGLFGAPGRFSVNQTQVYDQVRQGSDPSTCQRCYVGQWRHGKCTNRYCSAYNRVRGRDRRAFLEQVDEAANTAIERIQARDNSTMESRARHRQMGPGNEFRENDELTNQWLTTANTDWQEGYNPSASSTDRTWTCTYCR